VQSCRPQYQPNKPAKHAATTAQDTQNWLTKTQQTMMLQPCTHAPNDQRDAMNTLGTTKDNSAATSN
jgi:hypothetical protein